MAIAFYCEDEDPKLFQGYYNAFGYPGYQQHQQQQPQQQQQSVMLIDQHSQTQAQLAADTVDENNNNVENNNGQQQQHASSDSSSSASSVELMHILHHVLYRFTMEGALSPAHTSCAFCNKIYYLFQLLY